MRQFSAIPGNHFTTKLFEVITPGINIVKNKPKAGNARSRFLSSQNNLNIHSKVSKT